MKYGKKALSRSHAGASEASENSFSHEKRSLIIPKHYVSKHDSSSEVSDSEDNSENSGDDNIEEGSEDNDDVLHSSASDEEDHPDVDGPRVAQWEAEEELEILSDHDVDEDKGEGSSKANLVHIIA